MIRHVFIFLGTFVLGAVAALALTALQVAAMHHERPAGYRSWTHVKSMVITDKSHGLYGFHNTYGNKETSGHVYEF